MVATVQDREYNALVAQHFADPRNTPCHAPGPQIVFGEAGHQEAGAWFRLSAKVRGDVLEAVRFEAYGCPHSIAAASLLTEELRGVTRQDAVKWSWRGLAERIDLPREKRGRLLMLEDALHALLQSVAT